MMFCVEAVKNCSSKKAVRSCYTFTFRGWNFKRLACLLLASYFLYREDLTQCGSKELKALLPFENPYLELSNGKPLTWLTALRGTSAHAVSKEPGTDFKFCVDCIQNGCPWLGLQMTMHLRTMPSYGAKSFLHILQTSIPFMFIPQPLCANVFERR